MIAVAMLTPVTATQTTFADVFAKADAQAVLKAAGNPGGLAVVLGAGDGQLVAALAEADAPLIIEGLETDPTKVAAAEAMLNEKGLTGKATVRLWDGKQLPYVNNVVRLLVTGQGTLIDEEITRVLCPGGKWVGRDQEGEVSLGGGKPETLDGQLDDWTHYLKDASNNAVSADKLVGPPRKIQWLAEPLWSRNHHKLASISSVVTNGGRIFYIMDDGPSANMSVPGRWSLVARDAYSGTFLWKKPYSVWHSQSHGFRNGPVHLPRLLVADKTPKGKSCVFAKPGFDKPIEILDAATGKVLHTLADSEKAEEIIHEDGVLLTVLGDPANVARTIAATRRGEQEPVEAESVAAFDTDTGKLLWKKPLGESGFIASLTLSADKNDRVFVQNEQELFCLDLRTGKTRWTAALPGRPAQGASGTCLVVTDGEVLVADGKALSVFDIESGEILWTKKRGAGFRSPTDVLVLGKLVWLGPEFALGLDLRTGEQEQTTIKNTDLRTVGHHHRCYRQKATERYILEGYRGIEMYDTEKGEHSRHNWIRGTCQYGIMPANGLMYAPSHACGCFMEAKLRGFWALSPSDEDVTFENLTGEGRLTKGPAYGVKTSAMKAPWPTLRGNGARGGSTETNLPGELSEAWETDLGGPLTAPILADSMALVAKIDDQEVIALDATDGKVLWRYNATGRIDSPPTWHEGLVLFGSCDGFVYAVDGKTGRLAWRFLAAPQQRYTVVRDQVESLWPVSGTVLIQNDTAYVAAGRSTYIDGGIALWGLNPKTGQVKSHSINRRDNTIVTAETKPTGQDPKMRRSWVQNATDEKTFLDPDLSDAFSMAGNVSGILSGDGKSVFLRHEQFDGELNRQDTRGWHLFSTSTLLDDAENHRSHWVLGYGNFTRLGVAYSWIANRRGGSWSSKLSNPYGIMLSFDKDTVWGVRRGGKGGGYTFFAEPNRPKADGKTVDFRDPKDPNAKTVWHWEHSVPLRPHAMLKAADKVVLAGMPTLDGGNIDAFEGREGGILTVRAAQDGSEVSVIELDAPPVWDGLAAEEGLLVISGKDGRVRGLK
jgi:outer membrane protein assembly factor BamB